MKFHDELNPVIWDTDNDNQMRPEVLAKLKEIANAFIEYIEIPEDALLDMVVTGSSASYNYNEFSDLDLHIIVDYDKIHEDCPLVEGYLGALKNTFNKEHDIYIHGVPVELYAEKKDQGTVHNGLYSVQNEEWIDRPQKIAPTDNDAAVEAKYNEIKEMVDKCADSEAATELLEKIYAMRKAGLAEAGEFCTENLAFKKLRNEGCMDKLREIKKKDIDKQLSLESYNESLEQDVKELTKTDDYYKVDGSRVSIKNGFGSQVELMDLQNLGKKLEKKGYKVYYSNYYIDAKKNESIKETLTSGQTLTIQGIWNAYEHGLVTKERTLQRYEEYLSENNMAEGDLIWAIGKEKWDHLHNIMTGNPELDDEESIEEDYEEDDCEDCPEEMHKERYVTYFETPEGRQKYTIYHVYTDSTDDSYNELCDKRDNQLGMYNSYKELKDALKEKAEKIAKQQGWTVKSIENLGEDDDYYRERNKWESMKENIELPMDTENEPFIEVIYHYGRPLYGYRLIDGILYYTGKNGTKQIGKNVTKDNLAKRILSHAKNATKMDIEQIKVDDEIIWDMVDGFNESLNEGQSIKKWAQSMLPEIFKLLRKNGIPSKDYCVLGHVEICPNANFLVRKTDVEKVLELLPMAKENEYWDTKGNAASIRIEYDGLREFEKTLKSKNEEKEMNEDIKTEYAIINFLKKYGFATQEDLYNNIGAQVFVIDNAVKELLKQDKIKFEDGQGQDGINGWKLTEQIEEDLATLEKKVDKAEQDIQDIIASYTTNESIYAKLDETFKKALGEEVKIDTHSFQFDVDGYNISGVDENGIGFEVGFDADQDIKEVIEEYLDDNAADFFEEDGEITSTEVTKYFYKEEGQIGGFEFNIFFE